jgi:hypothetical protein
VDQVGKDSRCEGLWITDNPAAGFIKLHGIDQVLTLKKKAVFNSKYIFGKNKEQLFMYVL